MKKQKISIILVAAMVGSCLGTAPVMAATGSTSATSWKFDFGADGQTPESGYYSVTPSTEFNSTSDGDFQYGLYGQNKNDYKLANYEDGVTVKSGQYVNYAAKSANGSGADSDCLGIGDLPEGQTEGLYPIRFAMTAENNGYYKVKVHVTTLDNSKPATSVNVYSERRHPIVTNQTIAAGDTTTVEFTASIQSILVKDRTNGGNITYKDNKLNVMVLGDNAAISSIEVEKTDSAVTVWCYDDSTGCDYPMLLPYFPLQNYGGTAQYLSKYLPSDTALVNQGDGGLAANATSYFNLCKNNIKAGDYIYLQYGHNHKNDGAAGYVTYLNTYYSYAASKGANMVFVGPIDRHNQGQYDASTNTWSSSLGAFSKAAKYYTQLLICGGSELAETFVSKVKAEGGTRISDTVYAWADEEIAKGITDKGVTNVAFIDLNQPTLDWLSEICDEVKTATGASSYSYKFSNYYFRSVAGSAVDGTHENDYGADATASFFFDGIKELASKSDAISKVQYAVLKPLVINMRNASKDYVSNDIYNAGAAPNSKWPAVYQSSDVAELPINIKSIEWNDDGTISSVKIAKNEAKISMDSYGKLELIIKDKNDAVKGTINSTQVDNTWQDGSVTSFTTTDATNKLVGDTSTVYSKSDGDTFTAIVYKALDDEEKGLIFDETSGSKVAYSDYYQETDVLAALIKNEDGNAYEDFNFYGVKYDGTADIHGKNGWTVNGSASKLTKLHSETVDGDTRYYTEVGVSNNSTSYSLGKKLSESISGRGRIKMTVDLKDNTGGNIKIGLANKITTWPNPALYFIDIDNTGKVFAYGSDTAVTTLSKDEWQTVTAVADLDFGTLTISCGENSVTTDLPEYSSTEVKDLQTYSTINIGLHEGKAGGAYLSNLSVLKLKSVDLPTYTLDVKANSDEYGTVTSSASSGEINSVVTVKAVPNGQLKFVNWKDEEGNVVSTDAEYSFLLKKDIKLTAYFGNDITVNAVDENGDVIQKLQDTSGVPNETYSLYIQKMIQKDGVYYVLDDNSVSNYKKSFTGQYGDSAVNVSYKQVTENVVAYVEDVVNASDKDNTSGGKQWYVSGGKIQQIAVLPAGKYKIVARCMGNGKRTLRLRNMSSALDATNNQLVSMFSDSTKSGTEASGEFTLTEETTVGVTGYTNSKNQYNQSAEIDYIYIVRTDTEKPKATAELKQTFAQGTGDAATLWEAALQCNGETFNTVNATVTDNDGKTATGKQTIATNITTSGSISVFVTVNKADIEKVEITTSLE